MTRPRASRTIWIASVAVLLLAIVGGAFLWWQRARSAPTLPPSTVGSVGNVRIHATAGGNLRLLSPWPGGFSVVKQDGGATVPDNVATNGVASFATGAGETYVLKATR